MTAKFVQRENEKTPDPYFRSDRSLSVYWGLESASVVYLQCVCEKGRRWKQKQRSLANLCALILRMWFNMADRI